MVKRIGGYIVRSELGRGGMATVYLAEEALSRRLVALKVLHYELGRSEDARRRFISEMQILTTLEHPNLVRCYYCDDVEGQLIMALEYVRGRTLRAVLSESTCLPASEVCRVGIGVLAALEAAHSNGPPIVHRDLKPENILIGDDGVIKVADFGIAKMLGTGSVTTTPHGTLQYMSPEQFEGLPVTTSTDLYSLGVVLYELLTGQRPFGGSSPLDIIRAHHSQQPPPIPEPIAARTPPQLMRLVFQLLQKDPSRRPPSARVAHARLVAIVQPPPVSYAPHVAPTTSAPGVQPQPPSAPRIPLDTVDLIERFEESRPGGARQSRLGLGLALGAVSVLVLGVVVVLVAWGGGESQAAPAASAQAALEGPGGEADVPGAAGASVSRAKPLPPPPRSPRHLVSAFLDARDPGGPVPVHPELESTDFTIRVMVRRDLAEARQGARIVADSLIGGRRPRVQIIRRPRQGIFEHWVLVGRYGSSRAANADRVEARTILDQGAIVTDLSTKCLSLGPVEGDVRECFVP